MTCDERLEALLNRAGQTLIEIEPLAIGDTDNLIDYAIRSRGHAQAAVMHLTEIIDRMETALVNVIGERDYLRKVIEKEVPCLICVTTESQFKDLCRGCAYANGRGVIEMDAEDDNDKEAIENWNRRVKDDKH